MNLRTDDQVWTILGEFEAFGPRIEASKSPGRWDFDHTALMMRRGPTTRSVGKGIPTETVGTSGAWEIKLHTDDQVWRNLEEFERFGRLST
jgi:hypothetical protein